MRKVLLVVVALIVLAIATTFLVPPPAPPPSPVLPNPNGYDQFIKAGAMITGHISEFDKMNQSDLEALVQNNTNALALVRLGFQQQCRVPLQFTESYLQEHNAAVVNSRKLAQVLGAESRLAAMHNAPDRSARVSLDTIQLGNEIARGGVLIDGMIGIAIEGIGQKQLQDVVKQLDAKSCRDTAKALEALDSQRQSWADLLRQEEAWTQATFSGPKHRITRLMTSGRLKSGKERAKAAFEQRQTKTRRTLIDLAARAYELEKAKRPSSTADLVPDYLKAVPKDPVTGADMTYLP